MKKRNGKVYVIMTLLFIIMVGSSNRLLAQSDRKFRWEAAPENGDHQGLQAVLVQPWSGERKLRICILNPEEKKVVITISNRADVDFSTTTSDSRFDQIFNLEQVNDGPYQVEIKAGKEIIRKDIVISSLTWTNSVVVIR
jgi:hypothetical protein